MKKTGMMILGGIAAFTIFAGAVHAADDIAFQCSGARECSRDRICVTSSETVKAMGTAYVDADQDGICDNHSECIADSRCGICHGGTDNSGLCDHTLDGNGTGSCFRRRCGSNR